MAFLFILFWALLKPDSLLLPRKANNLSLFLSQSASLAKLRFFAVTLALPRQFGFPVDECSIRKQLISYGQVLSPNGWRNKPMDYDDNDFQNQNLHLAGEANNKFPPVLQPYALPKLDFDDTLNTHLRFDSLVETEVFLGIEGNEDSNWIEDFSRGSSDLVFSSGATESCSISRHINVWSEATSSESVEMLLNSVGQDEVIVRENTLKKSDTSDELVCTMEQMEPGRTNLENCLSKEETANLQPNPSVDETPGDSSVSKIDVRHEQVLVKGDSPTVSEESSMEEKNAIVASNTMTVEAMDTAGHDKIGTEITGSLLDQTDDEANEESRMESDCSHGTVQTVVTCSGELSNQKTLLPEASNNENEISDHIQRSYISDDLTIDARSVLVEVHSDSLIDSASEVENVEAKFFGETAKPDLKKMELSEVIVLERVDQALSTLEVGGQDVSGTQCHDLLVSSANTSSTVEASLEHAGELTTLTSSASMEKPELLSHQHMKVITSEGESTFQTETHTQIHLVETPDSIYVSHMDLMDESTKGVVSKKSDNNEDSARISNLKHGMELAVNDKDQHAKMSQILSESVVSEYVCYVSGGSSSKLSESVSQSDTIQTDKPGTMINRKECEAFPRNLEELQRPSQDGAPAVSLTSSTDLHMVKTSSDANQQDSFSENEKVSSGEPVSLTSSIDLHMVKTSSDANEQGSFSDNENVSSGKPENGQTVPPVDASSSGNQMDQQDRKHTEDTQQSTQFVRECPASDANELGSFSENEKVSSAEPLSLTSSIDLHKVKTFSDANEQCSLSENEKVSSGEPENGQTVLPVDASSSGSQMDQQARKHTEDTQQITQVVGECPASDVNEQGSFSENERVSSGKPVSLTSSIDLHMVKTSSDANEQGSFSENEKVSSGEPENGQTVLPVDASSSGSQMNQQGRKHTEDTQQSTHFVGECPASEGSKDAVDSDATAQDLLQQSEETVLEENLVLEVVNAPETQPILGKDDINEKPNTSSLANLGSEAGKDGWEEDISAASGGLMTAGTPVSHPKGDAIETLEPSVKSHVTGTENPATELGTPLISFPTSKTSEVQLNKTETNSVKKPEDQNILSFMSAGSLVLNRNETFSSGMNLTSDAQKVGETSKAANFPQTTLVSQIVVGSPSTSYLEKTAAQSSKTKPERKPRRTSKSAGKESSRKGNSVKEATPFQNFQSGGKTNAVNQITQSTEKQQSLQTPALKAFGTLSTPTASLLDLNSSALSSILRRPFTDLQQVQLRAQIFVYGALIQGTAPDEVYMISAFGGPDGGKGSWNKAWRACVVRAQKLHVATPETPLQSRAGSTEAPSAGHTSSKESSATNPIIPLSSPLWSLSTPLDTLQSSSIQRGSAAAHQVLSSSHAHQTPPITNIGGHNTPWMLPIPYRNPWLASPQTSGFDVGSRLPFFTEPLKLTPMKESALPYSGVKLVQSETSSNVFKGTPTLEPMSTVVAPAQHSTGTKSRKRKKMPASVESGPSILNSLKQTELVVSPFVSISTSEPITTAPANLASNAGALANVVSITAVPTNLVSTFPGKKIKSSLPSPIFGGNLVHEVKQRSVLSEDTIDKLKEAKMHAEDASTLATAAVSYSQYVWKQIEQQRHAGLQPETQGRLASAAVAVAAAAAVAKAAAAAANVAANAALQAKLMAEEASLPIASDQGNELPKSNDNIIPGQGTSASILKGEGAVVSSSSVLIAAREEAKKRVEAATAATKRAENMDSIVKAAELASEAVSQAGILVSMGHPPLLNKLVEAGPSNYWRQSQESQEVQPSKTGVLEKEIVATSDGTFGSPRTVQTELDGSVRMADGVSGTVSDTGQKTKGQKGHKGADLAKNTAVVFEPEAGLKSLIDAQTESEQILKTLRDEDIKEGSSVEVFKEGPGLRTAWYSANVLCLEDDKAYVLFTDLSVEQGMDKLKEWVALKGEGDEAPKIRTARSVTAMPYEGTRKRRRSAIGDPVWKIGDRVDSWVHDSWLEGVITEKNKKDENTVTVHFPAHGDTLTIKAWNLRPSLLWKDGKWIECSSSGENVSSSHEGDTPKEKRPRLGTPALLAEGKDTSMKVVDDPDLGKPPQTGILDLGVSENTFNIGRSTREGDGLQKQGSKVIFGVPKPGKKRKFMDVSKHYVSEVRSKTRERKEPAKPVKSIEPHNLGSGSWRIPSKTISREKQTTISKPKTKEKPGVAARIIPRKDSRNTTASNMESVAAADHNGPASGTTTSVLSKGTGEEQTTPASQDTCSKNSSSSSTNKGKVAPTAGRLAKIEEDKTLANNSLKTSDGLEPRRSIRRIQPTSRLLEGLQTSMMASKIPSVSHSRSQSRK